MPRIKERKLGVSVGNAHSVGRMLSDEEIDQIRLSVRASLFPDPEKFCDSFNRHYRDFLGKYSLLKSQSQPKEKREYLQNLSKLSASLSNEISKLDLDTTHMLFEKGAFHSDRGHISSIAAKPLIDCLEDLGDAADRSVEELQGVRPKKRESLRLLVSAMHSVMTECAVGAFTKYSYSDDEKTYKGELVELTELAKEYALPNDKHLTSISIGEIVKKLFPKPKES